MLPAARRTRARVRDLGNAVTVLGSWAYRRDFDAVELKVATANIEYGTGMQTANEYKNIADLLGRGPSYPLGSTEVIYRRNQGYWRWEADIMNFNEVPGARQSERQPGLSQRSQAARCPPAPPARALSSMPRHPRDRATPT